MLDKDDENPHKEEEEEEEYEETNKEGGGQIDEDEMLDVAEKCFMRIAEAIIARGVNSSVREVFSKYITKETASTAGN